MSTSCERAATQADQPFPYLELGTAEVSRMDVSDPLAVAFGAVTDGKDPAVDAARDAGRQEGAAQARVAFDDELSRMRAEIAAAIRTFAVERSVYYKQVEGDIVQLSLNIARRILHREAQVDPLLLAGIVRVALDQLEAGTKTTVRVHPQQATEWKGFFSLHLEPQEVPDVVEDLTLEPGRCVIQTALGRTELGLEVQFQEIEKGLLDILAERPVATL